MSKHTPGPWVTCGTQQEEVRDQYGLLICKARRGHARLISAAPELLAALIELESRFETLRELAGYSPASVAAANARAAIAKARGES